jgi:hypothetical protein
MHCREVNAANLRIGTLMRDPFMVNRFAPKSELRTAAPLARLLISEFRFPVSAPKAHPLLRVPMRLPCRNRELIAGDRPGNRAGLQGRATQLIA